MEKYKAFADTGSVCLRIGKTYFHIPLGIGDGDVCIAVVDQDDFFHPTGLKRCGWIEGDFDVYEYDVPDDDNKILFSLSGKCDIYTSPSRNLVVFDRW